MPLDDWNDVFDVNVHGVVHGIQAVYPIMIRQHSGHIVNTASMAGLVTTASPASYAATKHAIVAMSKSLRLEAERHNVQVSVLCPGMIRTPMLTGGRYGRNASATRLSSDWGSGRGRWHPRSSPSAPLVPCYVETQSSWCRRGGKHCGTWSGFLRLCRCER